MPQILKTTLSTIFCVALSLALTACAPTRSVAPEVSVQAQPIPKSLRSCKPLPEKLSGQFKEREAARYVVNLESTAIDCKNNLAATDKLLTEYEKKNPAK